MTRARSLDRVLTALADPNRRRVVELLREEPRRAGALAAGARLTPAAMSRHLKLLKRSGLVAENRDALDSRVRIYRLRPQKMNELKTWLAETETLWTRQLTAFKAHLQKPR